MFLVFFELVFELSILYFFALELFDEFGHLFFTDIQSGLKLVFLILGFEILELEILRNLLKFIDFGPKSFDFFVVKLSVDIKQLDLKAFIDFFELINLVALLLVLLSEFIVFDFELFKDSNLSFDLHFLAIVLFVLILLINGVGKR